MSQSRSTRAARHNPNTLCSPRTHYTHRGYWAPLRSHDETMPDPPVLNFSAIFAALAPLGIQPPAGFTESRASTANFTRDPSEMGLRSMDRGHSHTRVCQCLLHHPPSPPRSVDHPTPPTFPHPVHRSLPHPPHPYTLPVLCSGPQKRDLCSA